MKILQYIRSLACITGVILVSTTSSTSQAQFYQNLTIGNPKAIALGNAVTADPPGVDSIHFNPAGLQRATPEKGLTEIQLIVTQDPEITFSSQWTGEYPDNGLTINDCDIACILANEDSFEKQTTKVTEFTTYVPFKGPDESGSVAPKGGMVYRNGRFAFGMGAYITVASGYNIEPGEVGEFPRREGAIINFVMSAPGFAYKIRDDLTLGISFPLNYSGLALNTAIRTPNLFIALLSETLETICTPGSDISLCTEDGSGLPLYDSIVEVEADAQDKFTPSYNLGALWEPTPWLTVGAVYQGEVKHKLKGEFIVRYDEAFASIIETGLLDILPNTPDIDDVESTNGIYTDQGNVTIEQTMPAHFSVGVSVKVLPQVKLNVDYKKTFFSKWDELVLQFDRPTYLSAITGIFSDGGPDNASSSPQGFKDGDNFAFGLEYQVNDRWVARLGYEYRPSIIPPENRTLTYPIGDTRVLGLGGAYQLQKNGEVVGKFEFAVANIHSHQSIPSGSSYVTTWNPTELFASYPGYHLESDLETSLAVFSYGKYW